MYLNHSSVADIILKIKMVAMSRFERKLREPKSLVLTFTLHGNKQ